MLGLVLGLTLGLHVAPGSARAQGPVEDWEYMAWEALYDSRLSAALSASPAMAKADYERAVALVRDDASPLRAEIEYWIALSLLRAGDVDGAARELATLGGRESLGDRDRALSSFIDARRREIARLPFRQDFDDTDSPAPWVRSWQREEGSDLELLDLPDGNRVVVWSTMVERGREDALIIPFRDQGPSTLRFALKADRFPAWVRCMLEDDEGQQWTGKFLYVPTDTWTGIQLTMDDFTLVGDPRSGRRPEPRRVRSFLLLDVTGYRSEERDLNRIYLDAVEALP